MTSTLEATQNVATPRRSRRSGLWWARLILAIVIAAVILFPLYWMLVVAFSSRAELLSGALRLFRAR